MKNGVIGWVLTGVPVAMLSAIGWVLVVFVPAQVELWMEAKIELPAISVGVMYFALAYWLPAGALLFVWAVALLAKEPLPLPQWFKTVVNVVSPAVTGLTLFAVLAATLLPSLELAKR
jgi:hypothetical protein